MGHGPSISRLGVPVIAAIFVLTGLLSATGAVVPSTANAEAACPERIGHWPYGRSFAVAADGDTAFFGVGTALRIADVSSPVNPVLLSEILLGDVILDMDVAGGLLVAAISRNGVVAVDVSDPANPVLLDTLPLYGTVYAVSLVEGNAFVGGQSLWVVDLSMPSNMTVAGELADGIDLIRDMAVSGSLAVLADENAGLHIVDISDPTSPTLQATYSVDLDRPLSIDLLGDYAYLLKSDDDLVVFDISNPLAPAVVNRFDPGDDDDRYATLAVDGSLLYVGHSYRSELIIFDLSNPVDPVELWNGYVGIGANGDFAFSGSTLLSARYHMGLGLIDVSTPSAPQHLAYSPGESKTNQVALWDTYAVTVMHSEGLGIFDVSDPASPVEVSRHREVNPNDLVVRDGYAYTVSPSEFAITDLTNPSAPQTVGSSTIGGTVVALMGDLAVLGRSQSYRVFDIGDLTAPVNLVQIDVDYYVTGIATKPPAFYIPESKTGLHVFDATVPSAPIEVAMIEIPNAASNAIATGGDLLAVGDYGNGIRIYDVSNPLQPVETVFYRGLKRWRDFAFNGSLLLVTPIEDGLHVLDLSDPSDPVHLGDVPLLEGNPNGLASAAGLAIVGEKDAGFEIFELDGCVLEPPAAGFSWSPFQPWVGATVEFTDASSGGITGWSWTFGDGGTSTEASPSYSYSAAGTYSVGLTVSGPLGTDSVTKNITVTQGPPETPPIEQAGARQWIIPAAAHSPGAQGTNWVSDVVIHNPGSQTASANVYFLKSGQNNSGVTGRLIEVPAATSVALDDIVQDRFGWSNASGAVLIGCNTTLRISSRTYNDAASGTFGQFISGTPLGAAVVSGRPGVMIQLSQSEGNTNGYRTNLGLLNTTGVQVEVLIELFDSDGTSLGSGSTPLRPFEHHQINRIFRDATSAAISNGDARVSTTTPQGAFLAYASVVDNRSGDPVYIPAWVK